MNPWQSLYPESVTEFQDIKPFVRSGMVWPANFSVDNSGISLWFSVNFSVAICAITPWFSVNFSAVLREFLCGNLCHNSLVLCEFLRGPLCNQLKKRVTENLQHCKENNIFVNESGQRFVLKI